MEETLPLLKDSSLLAAIHRELTTQPTSREWQAPPLLAVVRLAWALSVAGLRMLPQNKEAQDIIDDDEFVVDLALEDKVFHILPNYILGNK